VKDQLVLVRCCGRSDDGQYAVLRQEHIGGDSFLWEDPDGGPSSPPDFEGFTTGRLRIHDGREFAVTVAGGRVFFRSPRATFSLYFRLLPAFPSRVDIEVDAMPGEVDEGTEFRPAPPPLVGVPVPPVSTPQPGTPVPQ
jgi:hypothetical protein